MKFAIVGAGGVGGYFGARLAADGNDVVFLARGRQREAMARDGLRVLSVNGDLHIETPQLHDDPATTGLCDIILVCTKLWDLEAVAETIRPLLAHDTAVVPLQNGVDAEDILTEALGAQYVVGGVAHIAAAIESPGVIRHTGSLARLAFGEPDGSASWRLEGLLSACIGAGIEAKLVDNIESRVWEKFALLVPVAGACALDRCPLGEVLAKPERRQRFQAMMDETIAVGRAKGIVLRGDLGERLMAATDNFPAHMKPSMLHDLEAGRRLELPWLNGAVVRLGRELGVETPANETVLTALEPLAMGGEG